VDLNRLGGREGNSSGSEYGPMAVSYEQGNEPNGGDQIFKDYAPWN